MSENVSARLATGRMRLLPGDVVPPVRLARILNRTGEHEVRFDRPTVVTMWSVGCGACLPAIEACAEIAAAHQVPCYGIATMVRDVEAAAKAVDAVLNHAIFAVEAPPSEATTLVRGQVTRDWLEPSGIESVPAAFLVDRRGILAWIGHPDDIETPLLRVVQGDWDYDAARNDWQTSVSDLAVSKVRITRDVTDAFRASDSGPALAIIEDAKHDVPGLTDVAEFDLLELSVLASDPARRQDAVAHLELSLRRFEGDPPALLRFCTWSLHLLLGEPAALHGALASLRKLEDSTYEPDDICLGIVHRLQIKLALIKALQAGGGTAEAGARWRDMRDMPHDQRVPDHIWQWVASELDRLRPA